MSNIEKDKEFWYKIKVDYDQVPSSPDHLKNLVLEFFKGRKAQVETIVGNPEDFANKTASMSDKDLRKTLQTIYIDHQWDQSKTGPVFEVNDGKPASTKLDEVFTDLNNSDMVIERQSENYVVVYHVKTTLMDESDPSKTAVHGRRFLSAEPSFIKMNNGKLEIRGRRGNLSKLTKKLHTYGVYEQKPQLDTNPIISSLTKTLGEENQIFDIIGIKYAETNLPTKSKLVIQNDIGIHDDIRYLGEKDIIIPEAITDISQILLKFKKLGKKVKLKIKHHDEGFEFEIDDKKLTAHERMEIKEHLEKTFDISFDKIHDYATQYDERFIFHKILAGNKTVYEKYFESIPEDTKQVLNDFLNILTLTALKCSNCERDVEGDVCSNCGGTPQKQSTKAIVVNDEKIHSFLFKKLTNAYKSGPINGLELKKPSSQKFNSKKVIHLPLIITEHSGRQSVARYHSFYLQPVGSDNLSQRIGDFLLDAVPVEYGRSAFQTTLNTKYGILDLYMAVKQKNILPTLKESLETSLRLKDGRLVEASRLAIQRLDNLDVEDYSPKGFEKDVFSILKRMFPYSERWGREGKKESDGIVIFADANDEYFVASYDPKLTKSDGYDLDSSEQNKATFYILDENSNKEIKLLTRKGKIDAHIFVSNKFKKNQIKSVYDGVKKFFQLATDDDTLPPLVFLPIDKLIDIYKLYDSNWAAIKGNVQFHKEFFESVSKSLKPTNGYHLVSDDDLSVLKENIIRIKDKVKKKSSLI